ncbi:hypothetical protein EVG20_g3215 [Dentipellis fragilis]|uniref:Protein kinase domain-containing protein n=1 Tax=Dentipellis fragilis TaxID=205917 RepID=A0A4Y9Z5W9_9AGAM|nr:hypothetical protein EVG20_g3215 [Dentipellis fragilis]
MHVSQENIKAERLAVFQSHTRPPSTTNLTPPATLANMRGPVSEVEEWRGPEADDFGHTVVVFMRNGKLYRTRHPIRMSHANIDDLPLPEEPIPEEHFCGECQRDPLTIAPSPPPPDAFIKMPQPADYDPEYPKSLGQSLADEAEVYEILKAHPYPNICVYYGAVRQGDSLTALCLRRHTSSLADLVQQGAELDAAKVLEGITAGVKHLHSLGLVHNDLNPDNIMLGEDEVPVLVDFDSCGRVGEPMGSKGGTPGWERPWSVSTITEERDIYALELLDRFLRGEQVVDQV